MEKQEFIGFVRVMFGIFLVAVLFISGVAALSESAENEKTTCTVEVLDKTYENVRYRDVKINKRLELTLNHDGERIKTNQFNLSCGE